MSKKQAREFILKKKKVYFNQYKQSNKEEPIDSISIRTNKNIYASLLVRSHYKDMEQIK